MKVQVLYREDGRIVSLSRVRMASDVDDRGVPPPRSGAEAREGQRVAIVDLDPAWHGQALKSIHASVHVIEDARGVRLQERAEK